MKFKCHCVQAGSVLSLKPARESAWTRKRQWEPEDLSDGDDDMAQAIAASLGHEPGTNFH